MNGRKLWARMRHTRCCSWPSLPDRGVGVAIDEVNGTLLLLDLLSVEVPPSPAVRQQMMEQAERDLHTIRVRLEPMAHDGLVHVGRPSLTELRLDVVNLGRDLVRTEPAVGKMPSRATDHGALVDEDLRAESTSLCDDELSGPSVNANFPRPCRRLMVTFGCLHVPASARAKICAELGRTTGRNAANLMLVFECLDFGATVRSLPAPLRPTLVRRCRPVRRTQPAIAAANTWNAAVAPAADDAIADVAGIVAHI